VQAAVNLKVIIDQHPFAGVYSSQLDPQQDFSCLAVVLDMALTPSQPQQQPLLYEQCLEVLYRLAEQMQSREAMLCLLRRPPYSLLMSQIEYVLQVDEEQHQEVSVCALISLGAAHEYSACDFLWGRLTDGLRLQSTGRIVSTCMTTCKHCTHVLQRCHAYGSGDIQLMACSCCGCKDQDKPKTSMLQTVLCFLGCFKRMLFCKSMKLVADRATVSLPCSDRCEYCKPDSLREPATELGCCLTPRQHFRQMN